MVKLDAVERLLPSWTRVKSSERRIKIKTANIETFESSLNLNRGAVNKSPNTPITTAQRIKDILGKYWSFTLNRLKSIRTIVETAIIRTKRPIPTTGPVATKTTDKAAGRNIPNPLIPTTFLEKAITKVTIGRSSNKTIVFAGTPAATAPRIAYLTGLYGQTGPRNWEPSMDSKGPKVSSVFWVMSGTGVGAGVITGVALAVASGEGVKVGRTLVWADTEAPPVRNRKINPINTLTNIRRMGVLSSSVIIAKNAILIYIQQMETAAYEPAPTAPDKKSIFRQIDDGMYRLRYMSQDGVQLYDGSFVRRFWEGSIGTSVKATYGVSAIRRFVTGDKTPKEAGPNTAINKEEGPQGILGAGGPHEKNIFFRRNVVFLAGIKHPLFSPDSRPVQKVEEIKRSRQNLEKYTHETTNPPDKFLIQPLMTSLIGESLEFFDESQYPDYKPERDQNGNRELKLGKLKRYSPNEAVRLVFHNKDNGRYGFVNIDEDTYYSLEDGTAAGGDAFFLSKIICGEVNGSQIEELLEGTKVHDIDDWFDEPPAKVAIGAVETSAKENHILSNRHITDPRFGAIFMVQYEKTQIPVNSKASVVSKDELKGVSPPSDNYSSQLLPVAVFDQVGHSQATAMPFNRMLDKALSAVCFADPENTTSSTYIEPEEEPYVLQIVDQFMEAQAHKLSGDLTSLKKLSFSFDGPRQMAEILNIRELRSIEDIPASFISTASLNRKLHFFISKGHPIINSKNPLENTIYFLKTMSANSTSAYLAVEPSEESKRVNNALAIAVHGNGNNDIIEQIVGRIANEAIRGEVNKKGERVKIAPDPIEIRDSLIKETGEESTLISDFFAFQRIVQDEIFAAKRGESTAGTLALATDLGSARFKLENFSAKKLGTSMVQLLATKMLSSTGKDSKFLFSVAETEFFSSISKTAIYSHAQSGNKERVRIKPDDPIGILELVDKFEDINFYRGIRDALIGGEIDLRKLDKRKKTALIWINGKIQEIKEKDPGKLKEKQKEIESDLQQEKLREMLILDGIPLEEIRIDQNEIRRQAELEVAKRKTELSHIVFGDRDHYQNLENLQAEARIDAHVRNQLYEFADTITNATAGYLKGLEPQEREKFASPLRQLFIAQKELDQLTDLVDGVALAWGLNKYYLFEGMQKMYRDQAEITPQNLDFQSQNRGINSLDNFLGSSGADVDSFEDIQKIAKYGFENGISADTVIRFISYKSDIKPDSLYRYIALWKDPNPDYGPLAALKAIIDEPKNFASKA
jgi:hypothetical protein